MVICTGRLLSDSQLVSKRQNVGAHIVLGVQYVLLHSVSFRAYTLFYTQAFSA